LHHSYDHLTCWLNSIDKAIATCQFQTAQDHESAEAFFSNHAPSSDSGPSFDSTFEVYTLSTEDTTTVASLFSTTTTLSTTSCSTIFLDDTALHSDTNSSSSTTTSSHSTIPYNISFQFPPQ
jgi:hypothetical protein